MNKVGIILTIVILSVIAGLIFFNHPTSPTSNPLDAINPSPTPTLNPFAVKTTPVTATPTAVVTQVPTPLVNLKATQAAIMTSKGEIDVQLFPNEAPNTVENFIKKAQNDYYKNLTFHRVEDWVIQGGDPLGNGTGGGIMTTELNTKPFVVGSLGVARGQDIKVSNDSQFFITKTEATWLNGQYTNFGIVTKGIDIVQKMEIGDKILSITTK